jgi:hypothetical protein
MRDTGIMARHYPELLGVIDDVAEGLDRGSILLKERDGEEKFQVLFAVVVAKAADPAKFLTHFESEEDKKRGKKGSMASVRKEVVDAIVSSARGYGCISALAGVVDERAYLNQARMAVRDTKAPTWLLRDVHAVLMPEAREARDRFARVAEEYSLDELAKSVPGNCSETSLSKRSLYVMQANSKRETKRSPGSMRSYNQSHRHNSHHITPRHAPPLGPRNHLANETVSSLSITAGTLPLGSLQNTDKVFLRDTRLPSGSSVFRSRAK